MDIITPQRLYHGTTDNLVPAFRQKMLDSRFWRAGRDFGQGFYTTISAAQARKWAVKGAKSNFEPVKPCVLVIELLSVPPRFEPLVFLSDSLQWAKFIMDHRKTSKTDNDPCSKHPDIIIGPMADNDTGKIINECVQLNREVDWFYDQITRSSGGRRQRLDALHLGSQVVFSSEKWEQSLRLVGYYVQSKGRWTYHDSASSAESV